MSYKTKDKLFRPFIITDIINDIVYGIPLTSYNSNRYRSDLGDSLIKTNFLKKQSIIKPYQITYLKENFFIRKVGTVDLKIVKDINQKIDSKAKQYLAIKNTNAILRENIIERQNQKITLLKLENQDFKEETESLKKANQLLKDEKVQNNDMNLELE